jgi:selenium metabolism protein YedF
METHDLRGMNCPAPVLATKRALEASTNKHIEIIVDDGAARENVSRFLLNRGYAFVERSLQNRFVITVLEGEAESIGTTQKTPAGAGRSIVMITSDSLGDGSEELGRLLMKNFIMTLLEISDPPDSLLFLNAGVHLTTKGSEVAEVLHELGNRGVEISSCGLCLDYYNKKDVLVVGTVTNMYATVESLLKSPSVIRL